MISLKPSRNPETGGTHPMFPAIGSTITAAILSGFSSNNFITESMLLYSALSVFSAVDFSTPGLSGNPKVAAPDPAFIRKLSACPW